MEALYKAYKDRAEFFLVYIREAHPVPEGPSGGASSSRAPRGPDVKQTKTVEERALVASECIRNLGLSLPVLIDKMEGVFLRAYGGYPAGTTVVDLDGRVVFYSHGPGGCKPKEAEAALKKILARQPPPHPDKAEPEKKPPPAPAEAEPPAPGKRGEKVSGTFSGFAALWKKYLTPFPFTCCPRMCRLRLCHEHHASAPAGWFTMS